MSDSAHRAAAMPSCRRLFARVVVAAGIVLLAMAIGTAFLLEYMSYHDDIATCFSDNMYVLKGELEAYVQEHDGQMPETFDEIRARLMDKHGYTYDTCHRAEKPYIWMPPDVKMNDGRPVVLMCPPNSHGWLRRFAYGLVRHTDTFRFVRVRGKRATPFRWPTAEQ